MTTRVRLIVTGRVQGVGFRAACGRKATELGVGGHARNLPDGSVEVVAEGDPDAVDAMTQWCHNGPVWAKVRSVDITPERPAGTSTFHIG